MGSDILWQADQWVCVDCLVYHANGDLPENEIEASELLHDITKNLDGYRLTLGHGRELHDCKNNYTVWPLYRCTCELFCDDVYDGDPIDVYADNAIEALENSGRYDIPDGHVGYRVVAHELTTVPEQGGECDCEVLTFATKDCASCDRNIAGEWHAATLWKVDDGSPEYRNIAVPSDD